MNKTIQKSAYTGTRGILLALAGVVVFTGLSSGRNSGAVSSGRAIFNPEPDKEGEALRFDAKISGQAAPPTSRMAWWYRSPATKFWEGLPLGTGRFGAMVYGRVRDEIIPFNDETLWTGQPYNPVNPNGLKALPEIRQLALAGRFAEATKLATHLLSYPVPFVQTYQAMGRLHSSLEAGDEPVELSRAVCSNLSTDGPAARAV